MRQIVPDPLTGVASNGMSRTLSWGLNIPESARLWRFAWRGVATDLNDSSDAFFFSFRLGLSRCRLSWFNLRFPASFRWLYLFCSSPTLPWSSTLSGTSTLLIADASPLFAVLKVRMKTMGAPFLPPVNPRKIAYRTEYGPKRREGAESCFACLLATQAASWSSDVPGGDVGGRSAGRGPTRTPSIRATRPCRSLNSPRIEAMSPRTSASNRSMCAVNSRRRLAFWVRSSAAKAPPVPRTAKMMSRLCHP